MAFETVCAIKNNHKKEEGLRILKMHFENLVGT